MPQQGEEEQVSALTAQLRDQVLTSVTSYSSVCKDLARTSKSKEVAAAARALVGQEAALRTLALTVEKLPGGLAGLDASYSGLSSASSADAQQPDVTAAVQSIQQQFERKEYGRCLAELGLLDRVLDSAAEVPLLDLVMQRKILQIHLDASRSLWDKVLGLQSPFTHAKVRRQYKHLAQQVHPDKCSCFGAESAFQLISKASTKLQAQIVEGLVGDDYTKPHSPDAASDPAADWTMPNAFGEPKSTQTPRPFASPDKHDEKWMQECEVEELKGEVVRRQRTVLRAPADSVESSMSIAERQSRLRRARDVLGDRLANKRARPAGVDGGFCRPSGL